MTSRKRFACTMAHRTPDRVPLDIGGTPLTGMRPACQTPATVVFGLTDGCGNYIPTLSALLGGGYSAKPVYSARFLPEVG